MRKAQVQRVPAIARQRGSEAKRYVVEHEEDIAPSDPGGGWSVEPRQTCEPSRCGDPVGSAVDRQGGSQGCPSYKASHEEPPKSERSNPIMPCVKSRGQ